MADRRKVLTPKMIKACENYLKGMSMKKAMLEAGYAPQMCEGPVHVMRFLKNRQVIEYLRNRQEELAAEYSTDRAYIIKSLRHIIKDDNPKDRVAAHQLLERLVVPKEASDYTKEDIKSITINFEEARK